MTRIFETAIPPAHPAVLVREGDGPPVGICFAVNDAWARTITTALNAAEGNRRAIAAELAEAMNAAPTANTPHPEALAERASKGEGSSERNGEARTIYPLEGEISGADGLAPIEGDGEPVGGTKLVEVPLTDKPEIQWGRKMPDGTWMTSAHRHVIDAYCRSPGETEIVTVNQGDDGELVVIPMTPEKGEAEPVAWECHDMITDDIQVIRDREHAEWRAAHIFEGKPAWTVRPLFSHPAPSAEGALREALEPFLEISGEMFAMNANDSDVVTIKCRAFSDFSLTFRHFRVLTNSAAAYMKSEGK